MTLSNPRSHKSIELFRHLELNFAAQNPLNAVFLIIPLKTSLCHHSIGISIQSCTEATPEVTKKSSSGRIQSNAQYWHRHSIPNPCFLKVKDLWRCEIPPGTVQHLQYFDEYFGKAREVNSCRTKASASNNFTISRVPYFSADLWPGTTSTENQGKFLQLLQNQLQRQLSYNIALTPEFWRR